MSQALQNMVILYTFIKYSCLEFTFYTYKTKYPLQLALKKIITASHVFKGA